MTKTVKPRLTAIKAIKMAPDMLSAIATVANQAGQTDSEFIREAIRYYLKKSERKHANH